MARGCGERGRMAQRWRRIFGAAAAAFRRLIDLGIDRGSGAEAQKFRVQ